MHLRQRLLLLSLVLVTGCTWPVRQRIDHTVCRIANQPYDLKPENQAPIAASQSPPGVNRNVTVSAPNSLAPTAAQRAPAESAANDQRAAAVPDLQTQPVRARGNQLRDGKLQAALIVEPTVDSRTAAWLDAPKASPTNAAPQGAGAVQQVSWTEPITDEPERSARVELQIPPRLPGSETPQIPKPPDGEGDTAKERFYAQIYPGLPPLPVEPRPLPGPDGHPYTLTELQRMAAANSPPLRQAIADVQNAWGAFVQARTYANPQASYFMDPNANNTSSGVQGFGIEQVIKTAGKQKLAAASAWKDYENAQLALRRSRNELATAVRTAYFALLVDKETLAVTRAVARFTDEIYQLQVRMLQAKQVAAYEPATLRAQAFATRLAYQQAIVTYMYDWKSLVSTLGLEQLPLTEVGGQIDRFIPYYDYDNVRAYVLRNHTDILTARNRVPQARYKFELAKRTPIPDLDVAYRYAKDYTAFPFGTYSQLLLQMPIPVWDQNKGNIISAQAALARAMEEQHNAEVNLTNNLANAYTTYQNQLYAIEYYRKDILPDLVRYYRGVYQRRQVESSDLNVGDLAFAQQSLSQSVTAYLTVLGSMWSSVVTVASFLQTDDLFQMATPRPLPELPDFSQLSWACGHEHIAASCGVDVGRGTPLAEAQSERGRGGERERGRTEMGRAGEGARGRSLESPPLPLSRSPTPANSPRGVTTIQQTTAKQTIDRGLR